MTDMNNQQEIQQILMQVDTYKQQLESISKQGKLIENAISETETTNQVLDTLKTTKKGAEMLMPIGAGSYITVSLKDNEKVLVGAGGAFSVEKDIEEAKTTLEKRRKDMENAIEKISKQAMELSQVINQLNAKAEEMIRQAQIPK